MHARDDTPSSPSDSGELEGLPPPVSQGGPVSGQLAEGQVIRDRFRLDEMLGRGGMGTVWLAHDLSLDIDVAMKVIRPDVAAKFRRQASQRLMQEARASAKLVHPAIVRITDYGTTETDDPYIVMELLDGIDLYMALDAQQHISADRAVRTLLPILSGLKYAHSRGVLHRDIKPDNIFITRSDAGQVQPKLIDFGIARQQDPDIDHRITQPGAVMGSPGYMAPEQARGEEADERADIWSLCVVLYELVVGELPFEGKNYLSLMRQIIEQKPLSFADHRVGEDELWPIVEKGLAKDPANRWRSAEELGVELAAWLWQRGYEDDICGSSLATTWLHARPSLAPEDVLSSDFPPPRASGWHFERYRVVESVQRERATPPASGPPPSTPATPSTPASPSTPAPPSAPAPSSTPVPPRELYSTDPSPEAPAPPASAPHAQPSPEPATPAASKARLPLVGAALLSGIVGVIVAVVVAWRPSPEPATPRMAETPAASASASESSPIDTPASALASAPPARASAGPSVTAPPPTPAPMAPPPPRVAAPPPPPAAVPTPPPPPPAPPDDGDLMKPTF